jgi:uncharacterized protein (TIGR00369 family)
VQAGAGGAGGVLDAHAKPVVVPLRQAKAYAFASLQNLELPVLKFGVEIPFVEHLGFELVMMEGGASILRFEPKREHMNSFFVAHGGAIMTLLDVTLATAARSMDKEIGVVTIEMKTSFMQPARGKLSARGHLMHRTASMAFTEGTIFDSEGRACAHATGTFKYVRRLPTGPKSANPLNVISTD